MSGKGVEIFTDGACSGNPGPGGWGAILRYDGHEKELSGGEAETTNNRMELMAAIKALEALKRSCKVDVYTDSSYVQQGVMEWLAGWKAKGWPQRICGRSSTLSCKNTTSASTGSRAMPAIPRTSEPTNWPVKRFVPAICNRSASISRILKTLR